MRHAAGVWVLLFASVVTVSGAPWYETARFDCADPLMIRPGIVGGGWLNKTLPFTYPGPGRVFTSFPLSTFKSLGADQPPYDTVVLTAAQGKSLRKLLATSAANAETRALSASYASFALGFVLKIGASLGPSSVLNYLENDASSRAVTARVIGETAAQRGQIKRVLFAARDSNQHEYVYDNFFYEVAIGSEERSYLLTSCYFPVRIEYSKFKTVSPLNNKEFTRLQNGHWGSWDVDTQKFEVPEWQETDRDDEFVYFSEIGYTSVWRMSVRGGKWQHRRADGTWGTLYAQVIAE